MTTCIGNSDRIAAEFSLKAVPEEHRHWMFGTFCLWAGGQRIGRHDEECALSVARASFPGILHYSGQRVHARLMAMPAGEAFDLIWSALYENPSDLSDDEVWRRAEEMERFEVLPRGFDVFDGWDGFLIEDRLVGRLLWRSPAGRISEVRIGAGEFDRVIGELLAKLDALGGSI